MKRSRINAILQEGDASPADVFLTENSPAMTLVDGAGLFAPVDKDTLDQVPSEYRPSDGVDRHCRPLDGLCL